MDKKDELVKKLKELVANMMPGYPTPLSQTAKRLISEISALESEIKQEQIEADAMRALHHASDKAAKVEQCHAIYKKVKESWTPEQDPPNVITDKGIYDDDES